MTKQNHHWYNILGGNLSLHRIRMKIKFLISFANLWVGLYDIMIQSKMILELFILDVIIESWQFYLIWHVLFSFFRKLSLPLVVVSLPLTSPMQHVGRDWHLLDWTIQKSIDRLIDNFCWLLLAWVNTFPGPLCLKRHFTNQQQMERRWSTACLNRI